MFKKINFSFALQKLSIVALYFVFSLFPFSCQSSENDTSESIIGKWKIVAMGATENTISEFPDDELYWEFRSDETVHRFWPGPIRLIDIYYPDGTYTSLGQYEIDKDFLIIKNYYDDGEYTEKRYKYTLKMDQLKLTREPLFRSPAEIFVANYIIFKLVEK